jgi:hypothetical protein
MTAILPAIVIITATLTSLYVRKRNAIMVCLSASAGSGRRAGSPLAARDETDGLGIRADP